MADKEKEITIGGIAGEPPMEIVFGMAMTVRSPRTARGVTVMINPAALDYQDHPVDTSVVQVKQSMVMGISADTVQRYFDLDSSPTHTVSVEGIEFEFTLLEIGEILDEKVKRPSYRFRVRRG